jgi:hypothetical protein
MPGAAQIQDGQPGMDQAEPEAAGQLDLLTSLIVGPAVVQRAQHPLEHVRQVEVVPRG